MVSWHYQQAKGTTMANSYTNEAGEPLMTAAEARFEASLDEDAYYDSDPYDYEPDLDFGFEHDSAMASAGMGTDEDYGYYGDEDAGFEHDLFGDC